MAVGVCLLQKLETEVFGVEGDDDGDVVVVDENYVRTAFLSFPKVVML
jgi:hypothetical protein